MEELHRWLTEQSIAGVAVVQEGRVTYANARFCAMLGFVTGELDGTPVAQLIADADREEVLAFIRLQVAGGRTDVRSAFRGRRKDGTTVPLEVHGSAGTVHGKPAVVGV